MMVTNAKGVSLSRDGKGTSVTTLVQLTKGMGSGGRAPSKL